MTGPAQAGRGQTRPTSRPKTFLVLSQTFVPDPAAVGQHMAEAAFELARRGHRVTVLTSRRGYEDPDRRFPWRERIDGVDILRLPLSSFGKSNLKIRLLGAVSFVFQCIVVGLLLPRVDCVFTTTSPPMMGFAALAIRFFRRVPIKYWAMDLNPDQIVALGMMSPDALPVRLMEKLNRAILRHSHDVIVLDRFMADRLRAKLDIGERLTILPPWPHNDPEEIVAHEDNPFRAEHGLQGKFVIMYSGNHTPSNPLTTILQAAMRLKDRDDLVFLFIGGGLAKREVEQTIADCPEANIRSLPYQPLETIRYSLSAADVHLVSMGEASKGCCHPCKVYGAMALGRPILVLGPRPCHATDLLDQADIGWHVDHGDVEAAVRTIETMLATGRDELNHMGRRARQLIIDRFSQRITCGTFCDILERGVVG